MDLVDLEAKVLAFVEEGSSMAHPFNWTAKSFEKVLASVGTPPSNFVQLTPDQATAAATLLGSKWKAAIS